MLCNFSPIIVHNNMIIKRKLFSRDKKDSKAGKEVSSLIVNSGIKDLKKNKRKVIGLEEMFHNTDSPDAVLKEGIKAKFSEDPNNLTNTVLDDISYEGRKKEK